MPYWSLFEAMLWIGFFWWISTKDVRELELRGAYYLLLLLDNIIIIIIISYYLLLILLDWKIPTISTVFIVLGQVLQLDTTEAMLHK